MPPIAYLLIVATAVILFAVLLWYSFTRSSIRRAESRVAEAERTLDGAIVSRREALMHAYELISSPSEKLRTRAAEVGSSHSAGRERQAELLKAFGNELLTESGKDDAQTSSALDGALKEYNAAAESFNSKLDTFPSRLVASRMCLEKKQPLSI